MVFNTNQNRHFYLVNDVKTGSNAISAVGDIKVQTIGDLDKQMYFLYQGPAGAIKSDYIPLKNISYVKAINFADARVPLKKVELALASAAMSSSKPIEGQDYILRINFRQWIGMSDEDTYFKDAAVHITPNMSASEFYKAVVKALNLAFSKEIGATKKSNPYLKFKIGYSTSSESEQDDANWASATATKVIIEEKPQGWTLGIQAQERVYFEVVPTSIYNAGSDVIWGTVTDVTPAVRVEDTDSSSSTYQEMIPNSALTVGTNALGNGTKIADLEYFCMGERGDQYRMAGWPNYIPTKYLVDASKEYNLLEIHFAFTDDGANSYRSEKDITLAVPVGASGSEYTKINALISAINSAAGLSIATLE